jgi:hypothetical protein
VVVCQCRTVKLVGNVNNVCAKPGPFVKQSR